MRRRGSGSRRGEGFGAIFDGTMSADSLPDGLPSSRRAETCAGVGRLGEGAFGSFVGVRRCAGMEKSQSDQMLRHCSSSASKSAENVPREPHLRSASSRMLSIANFSSFLSVLLSIPFTVRLEF
jgi:hypothetical protein